MTDVRSDTVVAAGLLTQRIVDTDAAPLKASEYWTVLERIDDLGLLLGADVDTIAAAARVERLLAARIEHLLSAAVPFIVAVDGLEASGLGLLPSVHPDYPEKLRNRLGRAAPPILYIAGDPALLTGPLLGIVGSRDVEPTAADAAARAARSAVTNGHGVVSGGAKGIDRLAMNAALDAGGAVVGVLADSLLRAIRDGDVRRAILDGRLCLCTPYKPSAGFTVANAMARNKIIYALSRATVVVASDHEQGGTWAGATEALRHNTAPVLAWAAAGRGAGNDALVERGARPLRAVDELFPLPVPAQPSPSPSDSQLRLEL